MYYRHEVSTSRFTTKFVRYISRPSKCLAELLSRQAQKSVYCIMSCKAVVTFVLIEELFPQILVKLGDLEFYENISSVFWNDLWSCGKKKCKMCRCNQIQHFDGKSGIQQEKEYFHQQIWLTFK